MLLWCPRVYLGMVLRAYETIIEVQLIFPTGARSSLPSEQWSDLHFFFPAAFALAAFFLLLRIITTLKKDPTTAEPKSTRMTGMRMAQTRGGNMFCKGWSESTNGYKFVSDLTELQNLHKFLP